MTAFTVLFEFQTLLVGALGFIGVILTLRSNANQTKEQRNQERNADRVALRAGLLAELRINRAALIHNIERFDNVPPRGGVYIPFDPMDEVYRTYIQRLGLLTEIEVEAVMLAYLSLRQFYSNLLLVGEPGPRHVQVPAERAANVRDGSRNLLPKVQSAIDALEGVAKG